MALDRGWRLPHPLPAPSSSERLCYFLTLLVTEVHEINLFCVTLVSRAASHTSVLGREKAPGLQRLQGEVVWAWPRGHRRKVGANRSQVGNWKGRGEAGRVLRDTHQGKARVGGETGGEHRK